MIRFNKRRKANSESEGGDDRHVSVIGDGSGFAVSAVSAVMLPDINEMELTANHFCAVSVAVSAVSPPIGFGNGYRGNFHFQDVSGFAVSAVSAVMSPDINEMELTASDVCAVSGAVSAVSLPMDSGNGYRGNFHFQDVSGFAVSAVSAVILLDINGIHLTASDVCAVSGAVSAVSRPMDSGNLREIMKSPGFRIQFQNFSINCRSCGLHSMGIEAIFIFKMFPDLL